MIIIIIILFRILNEQKTETIIHTLTKYNGNRSMQRQNFNNNINCIETVRKLQYNH